MPRERLQKYLAACGISSRRGAEKLIQAGQVEVDGRVVTEMGFLVDPAYMEVKVAGRPVAGPAELVYYALYKPPGYLSTAHDERGRPTVLDLLPAVAVEPREVPDLVRGGGSRFSIYRAVFKEADTVEPVEPGAAFDLAHFRSHPGHYRGVFERCVPYLNVVVNCVYWEPSFPRLLTKDFLRRHWLEDRPRLRVIGDITADREGSIEPTVVVTEPGSPVYVYDPLTGGIAEGVEGRGPVIMAVDILPAELPRDASAYFSGVLLDYIPAIARADYAVTWEDLALPPEVKRAVIAYQGRLTPAYEYLNEHLPTNEHLQTGADGRTRHEADSCVGFGDGGWSARAVPARTARVPGHGGQPHGQQSPGGGGRPSAR